jgi:hypothetical protein
MAASSPRHGRLRSHGTAAVGLLAFASFAYLGAAGCTAQIGDTGTGTGVGGNTVSGAGGAGPGVGGNSTGPGVGGNSTGPGVGGNSTGPGVGGAGPGPGAGGSSSTGSGGTTPGISCPSIMPGRAPLRRLTTFEYNNTVRDLLMDTTNPDNDFPSEVIGNGFGNDADSQSVSSVLAGNYSSAAEGIAARATMNATALGRLATCASNVTTANEESCARTIATSLLPRAFRRTVPTTEVDEYVALYRSTRALSTTFTFANGVAAMIEAILQAPDFLYRVEFGTADPTNTAIRKLTGRELATRLSYFFWQTMPDAALTTAADGGMLSTPAQVMTQATRLLNDPKSHPTVAFFFDNLLPLSILTGLERDRTLYPTFSATIGQQMRQETQRMLEHEIFENTTQAANLPHAPGSWPAVLTAPYTFVNQALFNFYGASAFSGMAPTGTALTKVNLNTTQRLGVLTQGGFLAGTTTTNLTNPVLRGGYVVIKLMCRAISLPTDPAILAQVKPPDPYSGKTARERFSAHSQQAVCATCHQFMDGVGFALENFDAIGLHRTSERTTINGTTYDTPIDASGMVPGVGSWTGPLDMIRTLASSEEVQNCFATHWMKFAYGRMLESADACNKQSLQTAFKASGYNIKQLLLSMTQTDGFLYRPAQ